MAARYAHIASDRNPATHDSGPVHTPTRSACTTPSLIRMRPDAIAAAHIPSTNGVTSDAMPNTRVQARCQPVSGSPYVRNANAAPRITIPAIAMPNGTYSAMLSAANAGGNAANSDRDHEDQPDVVRLPHRADRRGDQRTLAIALGPCASRSHTPAAEVGAAEQHVERQPDADREQRRDLQRGRAHPFSSAAPRRRTAISTPRGLPASWIRSHEHAAPSSRYVPTVASSHQTMPPRVVTASAVRIWP